MEGVLWTSARLKEYEMVTITDDEDLILETIYERELAIITMIILSKILKNNYNNKCKDL